jgi:hypothetical protein
MKYLVYREALNHVTILNQLCVREIEGVTATRHFHLFGEEAKIEFPPQTWGESAMIKTAGKVKGKLSNRGEKGMFVGYAKNSASDTYRMFTPESNAIFCTRDVLWMRRMHYAPDSMEPIQAADSVELVTKCGKIPMRTTEKEEMVMDLGDPGVAIKKPKVTFQPNGRNEIIPDHPHWIVSFVPEAVDAMSVMSKDSGLPWDSPNSRMGTQEGPTMTLGRANEEEALDNGSLFNPQYSDVDSWNMEENHANHKAQPLETKEDFYQSDDGQIGRRDQGKWGRV